MTNCCPPLLNRSFSLFSYLLLCCKLPSSPLATPSPKCCFSQGFAIKVKNLPHPLWGFCPANNSQQKGVVLLKQKKDKSRESKRTFIKTRTLMEVLQKKEKIQSYSWNFCAEGRKQPESKRSAAHKVEIERSRGEGSFPTWSRAQPLPPVAAAPRTEPTKPKNLCNSSSRFLQERFPSRYPTGQMLHHPPRCHLNTLRCWQGRTTSHSLQGGADSYQQLLGQLGLLFW